MITAMRKGSRMAGRSRRSSASGSGREAVATLGRPSLALLRLVAGLLLASAFVAIEVQRSALARQAAVYRNDIAAAQATNAKLAADVAAKRTDDYVVNKARDYGYVLPGETLIGVQHEAPAPVAVINPPSMSHLQKWFALFFGAR
jgi:cell division protein FtsB